MVILSLWCPPYVVSAPAEPITEYFYIETLKVPTTTVKVYASIVGAGKIVEKKDEPVEDIDIMLDRLAMCESSGNENAIVLDVNNLYSMGLYQYQMPTWIRYGMSPDDIYDGEKQRELTKKIIEQGGWENWYNCGIKIGLNNFSIKK